MAQSDSFQDSLNRRMSKMENVLNLLAQNINNSSGTPSSPTGERSNDKSSIKNTRKRFSSENRDEESKKRRSDGIILECTMCDKIFKVPWTLTRHYKDHHKAKYPEDLVKRALMKANVNQPEDNNKSPARLPEENLPKKNGTEISETEVDNNCKLCEAAFNTTSAKNIHYTSKHQIKDGKLLFFPDGIALIESPLENEIEKNQEYFKTVVKRNMPSRVCKLCEIELDPPDLISHYERDHKVIQISKVKILIRLNTTDVEKLCPSIKCNYCPDTFTDTEALENHALTEHASNFNECQICKKRIEMKFYTDHVKNEHPDAKINKETEKQQTLEAVPLMYICGTCKLATLSYDNVIAHSQDHILNKVSVEPKLCEKCNLKFDADFPIHEQMHLSNHDLDRDSYRIISYDYKNLTTDKWFDMFDAFTNTKVKIITSASIYFSTRCIRLNLVQDCKDASAPFTLFKCLKCSNYVHPKCIESHVGERSACSKQSSSYICIKCTRSFYSSEAMDEHKETHNVPDSDSKYRTVLFNDSKDFDSNKALLENAGKSVLVEKEVINKNVATAQTPLQKVSIATSEANKTTEGVSDKVNTIESDYKMTSNSETERVADVYKCACGLCFNKFESLLMHMRNCSDNSTKLLKISCTTCKLDFDRENYSNHCKAHEKRITTFNVKKLILVDERKIDASGTK